MTHLTLSPLWIDADMAHKRLANRIIYDGCQCHFLICHTKIPFEDATPKTISMTKTHHKWLTWHCHPCGLMPTWHPRDLSTESFMMAVNVTFQYVTPKIPFEDATPKTISMTKTHHKWLTWHCHPCGLMPTWHPRDLSPESFMMAVNVTFQYVTPKIPFEDATPKTISMTKTHHKWLPWYCHPCGLMPTWHPRDLSTESFMMAVNVTFQYVTPKIPFEDATPKTISMTKTHHKWLTWYCHPCGLMPTWHPRDLSTESFMMAVNVTFQYVTPKIPFEYATPKTISMTKTHHKWLTWYCHPCGLMPTWHPRDLSTESFMMAVNVTFQYVTPKIPFEDATPKTISMTKTHHKWLTWYCHPCGLMPTWHPRDLSTESFMMAVNVTFQYVTPKIPFEYATPKTISMTKTHHKWLTWYCHPCGLMPTWHPRDLSTESFMMAVNVTFQYVTPKIPFEPMPLQKPFHWQRLITNDSPDTVTLVDWCRHGTQETCQQNHLWWLSMSLFNMSHQKYHLKMSPLKYHVNGNHLSGKQYIPPSRPLRTRSNCKMFLICLLEVATDHALCTRKVGEKSTVSVLGPHNPRVMVWTQSAVCPDATRRRLFHKPSQLPGNSFFIVK